MSTEIEVRKLRTAETPKKIIEADFPSIQGNLPISGGWGYTKEDAVYIDKNHPDVSKNLPFDGVGVEYVFVGKRIYEELIIFRSGDDGFSGIGWTLINQKLISDGDSKFDVLSYHVTAFPDPDWESLKREWEQNNGFKSSPAALEEHLKKRHKKTVHYTTNYWFNITTFF